jgi:hypothetical protein
MRDHDSNGSENALDSIKKQDPQVLFLIIR